jgi:hypothetical protein
MNSTESPLRSVSKRRTLKADLEFGIQLLEAQLLCSRPENYELTLMATKAQSKHGLGR